MKNHRRAIAVIGRGVIGLTTAIALRERGHAVHLLGPRDTTTSSWRAGAYWWPHKIEPADRVHRWAASAYRRYKDLAEDPASGVDLHEHRRYCVTPDPAENVLSLVDEWSFLPPAECPVDCASAFRAVVPRIDVPTFMPYLEHRAEELGVHTDDRVVRDWSELDRDYPTIVNCSGLGAANLAGDRSVFPIRGQVVVVDRPDGLDHSSRLVDDTAGTTFSLVLPRLRDVVIGGTVEPHRTSLRPDPEVTDRLIRAAVELVPQLLGVGVRSVHVGLRPGREQVRLEAERLAPDRRIVHNYGHGGGGYTVAWGCAEEAADLVENS